MTTVRAMLNRVQKRDTGQVSPILAMIGGAGGWAAMEADVEAGLTDGRYDSRDMPVVIACLRRGRSCAPCRFRRRWGRTFPCRSGHSRPS